MQKAVFLDRDGVINSDVGHYYVFKPDDFQLNDGLIKALSIWRDAGYIFIVITNQGGVARGAYTLNDVDKVHNEFICQLNEHNISIAEIYVCPHHNDYENCLCRKPGSLNIEKAIARFNIDVRNSFMIGDNTKDVLAAEKAGLKGIKIDANQSLMTIVDKIA